LVDTTAKAKPMLTLSLLTLTALWFAVLYRYPAYFVPKKSLNVSGENWIEVLPTSRHHEAPAMQEVA
jgi:hypothetical protein